MRTISARHTLLWLVAAMISVAACGAGDNSAADEATDTPTTSAPVEADTADDAVDEVDATSSTTEPSDDAVVDEADAPTTTGTLELPAEGEEVSFARHVQPILERSCVSCHGVDQAGADHVLLATADDAARNAASIALFTQAGEMPPWPASDLSPAFLDDPSLSDGEIAALVAWVDQGAALDVDASTPLTGGGPPSMLEAPDVTMTAVGAPYDGYDDVADDYRCLVFDPRLDADGWVLGTQFVPDQTTVVHHAVVTQASADLRPVAEQLDADDPGPGWTCYGGTGFRGAVGQTQQLAGWAPGTGPVRAPEGAARPISAGDFFVIQIHYHRDGVNPADASEFRIDLADDADLAAAGGSFDEIDQALYLGPAELPCLEGDPEPLCDRALALERVTELYGPFAARLPDFFVFACETDLEEIAATMTSGTSWTSCELPVTNPGEITQVFGHMHELGASLRLTLNPGDPDERILLDIPRWSFEWQFGYRPAESIVIERGDTIRIDCAWDRSLGDPVGWITWSDGTGDEMCYSSVATVPAG